MDEIPRNSHALGGLLSLRQMRDRSKDVCSMVKEGVRAYAKVLPAGNVRTTEALLFLGCQRASAIPFQKHRGPSARGDASDSLLIS
jgi:hypothetical protein